MRRGITKPAEFVMRQSELLNKNGNGLHCKIKQYIITIIRQIVETIVFVEKTGTFDFLNQALGRTDIAETNASVLKSLSLLMKICNNVARKMDKSITIRKGQLVMKILDNITDIVRDDLKQRDSV